jgi:hypothetical protein
MFRRIEGSIPGEAKPDCHVTRTSPSNEKSVHIVVAFLLPPPGESTNIGHLFRRSAPGGDELQYIHVHPSSGLLLVTMFLRCTTRQEALKFAESLCCHVMATYLSRSWVLMEVAGEGGAKGDPCLW